mgnify:CR=1 FL=1
MAQTIKQKCDDIGISLPTYYLRLKNGMTPEEALSTPNKRRASKLKPTPKPAPAPMPEPEDQEPRAPLMIQYGKIKSCVFESDFQNRQREFNKNRTRRSAKTAGAEPLEHQEKLQPRSYVEELGSRYRITPNKTPLPALAASPVEDKETEEVDNFEHTNLKPLCYGPKRYGVAKEPWPDPWNAADETKFNNACGGYMAVILNHTKDGEFKYQIYSTKSKNKLYTDDVVRFINTIIKICDPEGKTPFRVIAR